ncbi:ADP-ribosylglycohydrolase family protein [Variovorax sp. J22R133]|nr:ADP-ribosylglycohydrolase family protein [Variovorax sp. J22R133]MDM0116963.1 ADP-ribosylglycohydrolase family protein [Variovorax sp. J22R133]
MGTWSDDGALMLALLDSLATVAPFPVDDYAQRMLPCLRHAEYTPDGRVFDVGIQTSTALRRIEAGIPAHHAGSASERDNGSGALMRVLPVAGRAGSCLHSIGKALERCKLEPQVKVHSCYEAGRTAGACTAR